MFSYELYKNQHIKAFFGKRINCFLRKNLFSLTPPFPLVTNTWGRVKLDPVHLVQATTGEYATELAVGEVSGDANYTGVLPILLYAQTLTRGPMVNRTVHPRAAVVHGV